MNWLRRRWKNIILRAYGYCPKHRIEKRVVFGIEDVCEYCTECEREREERHTARLKKALED
jgi:hypothetical protein